jgi:hypothetical protein
MKSMPKIIHTYSFAALFAYVAYTLLFLSFVILLEETPTDIKRIIMAVGVGGFFIMVGDLLSLPYNFSKERYDIYEEFTKLCEILNKVPNLDNLIIEEEKANIWCDRKCSEAEKLKEEFKNTLKSNSILSYIGFCFTTIGFLFLFLVRDFDSIFDWFEQRQQYLAIISFFLVGVILIFNEINGSDLEKLKKDKGRVVKITHGQLCSEKHSEELLKKQPCNRSEER